MNATGAVARLTAMNAEELRFRLTCEARKLAGRVRHTVRPDRLDRRRLGVILDPSAGPLVADAIGAARRGHFSRAHQSLARHFSTRTSRWPLQAARRPAVVADLTKAFPQAADEARRRADKILDGRYDLLGYRDLVLSDPPDWHLDAVHGRRAPLGHWTQIPYLDPALVGDHKVIWEISRHQHGLILGTAFWLTGDPRYRERFIAHVQDWIDKNPPQQGVNWTSMLELGFRALSWTWAIEFFAADAKPNEAPWLVDLLVSLDAQLTHISQNLSRYFSPNTHLTGEALALYAVSLALPELGAGHARIAEGRRILIDEARRQIHPDGGHAELSAHYHRYTTEFYLLALMLARAGDRAFAPALEAATRRLAEYLRTIADDTGRLPLVGDDDGGQLFRFGGHVAADASATLGAASVVLKDPRLAVSAPGVDAAWIAGHLPEPMSASPARWPSRILANSGYLVSRWRDGSHLIFDAGPHGYLNGGHAHADALSIVLSVAGEPLLVDPGTATYVMDDELRARMRSARMHNTVTLDGREHAHPRGPFHWASRTDARFLTARTEAQWDFAVGTHDGYLPARHTRAVLSIDGLGWLIVDRIDGHTSVQADAWWHIHPSWNVSFGDGSVRMSSVTGRQATMAVTGRSLEVLADPALSVYAPEYGRIERGTALRQSEQRSAPFTMATFVTTSDRAAIAALAEIQHDGWVTCPFRIEDGTGGWQVQVSFPVAREAHPSNWPQPCIEQLVQSCVE